MPDAHTKRSKGCPTATDGNKSSKITIEHRCGSKQIQMTIDENTAGTLLKNLMADKVSLDASDSKIASVLTQAQMQRIQSLMDANNEEHSLQDSLMDQEQSLMDEEEVFNDAPTPVAATPPH
jgi:hypothetical protein